MSGHLLEERQPIVSEARARAILEEFWGLSSELGDLPSERDRNFLVRVAGANHAVLKISSSAEDEEVVAMENAAMAHVARTRPDLPIPRIVSSRNATSVVRVRGDDDRAHLARLVTIVPGARAEGRTIARPLAAEIGAMSARIGEALQGFFHPAGGRAIDWDIRRCPELATHAARIGDRDRRDLATRALARVTPTLRTLVDLPAHIHHADVTLTNVLVTDERITGVVDFGDMHHTATVCDLVASLTSVLRSVASARDVIFPTASAFLDGYQRVRPLEPAEADVIGDLVIARLLTTVLISAWRAAEHPDNAEYIVQYDTASWSLLEHLTSLDVEQSRTWTKLAGTSRAIAASRSDLRARRAAAMGGRLAPLFYREPLQFVRGEGAWLFDASGARFLDGYNNVPVLGHAHPAVNQAISRQQARLHTNSRYLHENSVELAERLVATMPPELDTCIFVSSGTEAVDLAWRMATVFTGQSGAIIADWAYHGVSHAVNAFTSNEWPVGYRPAHVATFPAPLPPPNGEDVGSAAARERIKKAVAALAERGHRPAMVLTDPMFTSAGILDATPEFMSGLVEQAHVAGALFLADEVQSGFGRTGPQLWRFPLSGIVPDFVTLGKPMGNGHPVAALVTRRAIADAFAKQQEHFSTFAGGPVACAAALTVLDVLELQGLPDQAVRVGGYLRARIVELGRRCPNIVAVRGTGLIAGIEVEPLDSATAGEPRAYAVAIVEALRQDGVLIGNTGHRGNVLKVRPPLVWTEEHADFFVERLERAIARVAVTP
jgi:4-aminobutyrate aminotransferase-like enzyme/Ser/Thr protein kinase RdoA (MazF antagonist)